MVKRILGSLFLIGAFVFGAGAIDNVTGPTKAAAATVVNTPRAVGTYNDFGQDIRLRIDPYGTNAKQFRVSYKEYGATSYTSFYVGSAPNITINNIPVVQTGIHVNNLGICLISVYSVAVDGTESAPFNTFVNVTR